MFRLFCRKTVVMFYVVVFLITEASAPNASRATYATVNKNRKKTGNVM